MASTQVKSSEILDAIYARHNGPEWVRYAEVGNSTGAQSRRRADAICMNIWPSKGFAIHGFEIKVSRADFLHEMKDITKAEAVGKFCDFWWLASPVGLIKLEEVPATWGLIELCKSGMRIKKQAPMREAEVATRGFIASLLRQGRDKDDAYIRSQIEAGEEKRQKEMQRAIESRQSLAANRAEKNAEWIELFEQKLGIQFRVFECPESMADRLSVAKSLDYGALERLKSICTRVTEEINTLEKSEERTNG